MKAAEGKHPQAVQALKGLAERPAGFLYDPPPYQVALGIFYLAGHGVEPDLVQARTYLTMAAGKSREAQFRLGVMFRDGIGTASDPIEARKWFGKAGEPGLLEHGHREAQVAMADACLAPTGASRDLDDVDELPANMRHATDLDDAGQSGQGIVAAVAVRLKTSLKAGEDPERNVLRACGVTLEEHHRATAPPRRRSPERSHQRVFGGTAERGGGRASAGALITPTTRPALSSRTEKPE